MAKTHIEEVIIKLDKMNTDLKEFRKFLGSPKTIKMLERVNGQVSDEDFSKFIKALKKKTKSGWPGNGSPEFGGGTP